jgi:hypothetical protein
MAVSRYIVLVSAVSFLFYNSFLYITDDHETIINVLIKIRATIYVVCTFLLFMLAFSMGEDTEKTQN